MFCDKYKNSAILYLYDELVVEEKKDFEKHLIQCPACSKELQVLTNSREIYRSRQDEELDPACVKEIVGMVQKEGGPVSLKLDNVFEFFKSHLSPGWRFAVVPLLLIVISLFIFRYILPTRSSRNNINVYDKVLAWNMDFDDSLATIDRQIDDLMTGNGIHTEKIFFNNEHVDESWESSADEKLSQIDRDIKALSKEIKHFKF